MVAVDHGPEVDFDKVAASQDRLSRAVMGHRGIRAGRDDGLERPRVGPVVEHQRLQLTSHGPFGAAGPQATVSQQLRQRRVGGPTRRPHQGDLIGILDFAERFHHTRCGNQFGSDMPGQFTGKRPETIDGNDVTFKADATRAGCNGPRHQMPGTRALDRRFQIRRLAQGLSPIPRVGDQQRVGAGAEHQQRRIRAGEPGQIAHIDQITDQQRIQTDGPKARRESDPTLAMCHGRRRYSLGYVTMTTWLPRGLVLAAGMVLLRLVQGTLINTYPTNAGMISLALVVLFGLAAFVWALLDGISDARANPDPDRRRDLAMRWLLAGLIAGVLSGIVVWVISLFYRNVYVEGVVLELSVFAAFTALLVFLPATLAVAVGRRLVDRTRPPQERRRVTDGVESDVFDAVYDDEPRTGPIPPITAASAGVAAVDYTASPADYPSAIALAERDEVEYETEQILVDDTRIVVEDDRILADDTGTIIEDDRILLEGNGIIVEDDRIIVEDDGIIVEDTGTIVEDDGRHRDPDN